MCGLNCTLRYTALTELQAKDADIMAACSRTTDEQFYRKPCFRYHGPFLPVFDFYGNQISIRKHPLGDGAETMAIEAF